MACIIPLAAFWLDPPGVNNEPKNQDLESENTILSLDLKLRFLIKTNVFVCLFRLSNGMGISEAPR